MILIWLFGWDLLCYANSYQYLPMMFGNFADNTVYTLLRVFVPLNFVASCWAMCIAGDISRRINYSADDTMTLKAAKNYACKYHISFLFKVFYLALQTKRYLGLYTLYKRYPDYSSYSQTYFICNVIYFLCFLYVTLTLYCRVQGWPKSLKKLEDSKEEQGLIQLRNDEVTPGALNDSN